MTATTTFGLAALTALTAVFLATVRISSRRRSRAGELRLAPLPAGMKHLAAHLGDLSGPDASLPVPSAFRRGGRRLGTLLGLR